MKNETTARAPDSTASSYTTLAVPKEDPEPALWPNDQGIHGWAGEAAKLFRARILRVRERDLTVPAAGDGLCIPDIGPNNTAN